MFAALCSNVVEFPTPEPAPAQHLDVTTVDADAVAALAEELVAELRQQQTSKAFSVLQQDVLNADEMVELISEELAAELTALYKLSEQAAEVVRGEWAGQAVPEQWARERFARLFRAYRGRP